MEKNFQILYKEPRLENWANKTPNEKMRLTTPICSVEKISRNNNPLFRYPKTRPNEEIKVVLSASFWTSPIIYLNITIVIRLKVQRNYTNLDPF